MVWCVCVCMPGTVPMRSRFPSLPIHSARNQFKQSLKRWKKWNEKNTLQKIKAIESSLHDFVGFFFNFFVSKESKLHYNYDLTEICFFAFTCIVFKTKMFYWYFTTAIDRRSMCIMTQMRLMADWCGFCFSLQCKMNFALKYFDIFSF